MKAADYKTVCTTVSHFFNKIINICSHLCVRIEKSLEENIF